MPKKQLTGRIVSNKMQKTVVVLVGSLKESAKYRRRFKTQKKYKADCGDAKFNLGDIVLMEECKPFSADKTWKVIKKIADGPELAEGAEILEVQDEIKAEVKPQETSKEAQNK
jgi:small subunit ribosomal protein S17